MHKQLVRRLVDDGINDDNPSVADEVCTERLASELREWFVPFRAGFADWRQVIDELVAEGDTVVARCRSGGTNSGEWLGVPATGRSMEVDEVCSSPSSRAVSIGCGASRTLGRGSYSWELQLKRSRPLERTKDRKISQVLFCASTAWNPPSRSVAFRSPSRCRLAAARLEA